MFGKGAIILVLGFGVIFGLMSVRLNELEKNAVGNMAYYYNVSQSHNLAVIGANVGLSMIYQLDTLRGTLTEQSFTSGNLAGGSFIVKAENINSSTMRIRSTSSFASFRDTVEVYFDRNRLQSFSMYAWMTNFEGNVFWVTGDSVWGKIHSNGNLHISGSPVFMEKVTTAKMINPKPGSGTSKGIYKKGYETGVAPINFPTDMNELIAASTAGGRKYNRQIWVTLDPKTSANNDGKAYIRYTSTGPIVDSVSLSDPSFNGVILGTDSVCVKGTVDGKLSIGSLENIYVVDDVKYENNPLVTPASDDVLGIVSNQNVIISNIVPATTNLEIHGSIFARTGSFTAQDYNSRTIANSGTLSIVGGIIQETRGAVGTSASGTLKTGYSKRYRFDPRLADTNFRPPFFPGFYRKTLAINNWWENVRIPNF